MTELEQPTVVHDEPCPEPGKEYRRGTLVETPYDSGFVGELKARWRHGERYWCPDAEIWWVEAGYEEEIEELVLEHFGHAKVVDADGSERYRDPSGDYEQGGIFT